MGIMEKKMEATMQGLGFRVLGIKGLLWYNGDTLYGDNGKENGNYYLGFRVLGFRVVKIMVPSWVP